MKDNLKKMQRHRVISLRVLFVCISISLFGNHVLAQQSSFFRKGAGVISLGAEAPGFQVGTWINGAPIDSLAKGQVYVLELTQVNCAPCRQVIPHLTALTDKYKEKVKIVSVYVGENEPESGDTAYYEAVRHFVNGLKTRVSYAVAIDEPGQFMLLHWLKALKNAGTPTSFIVNRKGSVVWYGPAVNERFTSALDEVVRQDSLTPNTLPTTAAVTEQALKLSRAGKYRESLHLFDSLITVNGDANSSGTIERKLEVLADYNQDSAAAYATTFLKKASFWGMGDMLLSLANVIRYKIQMGKIKNTEAQWKLALGLLDRAKQIHEEQAIQLVWGDLTSEAIIYDVMGEYGKAAASQRAAIEHIKKYSPQDYKLGLGKRVEEKLDSYLLKARQQQNHLQ